MLSVWCTSGCFCTLPDSNFHPFAIFFTSELNRDAGTIARVPLSVCSLKQESTLPKLSTLFTYDMYAHTTAPHRTVFGRVVH